MMFLLSFVLFLQSRKKKTIGLDQHVPQLFVTFLFFFVFNIKCKTVSLLKDI